jgi:uncharacterized protein with von Willebrand factor type A (vWA) domain
MRDKDESGPEMGRDQIYVTDRWSRYQWGRYLESEPKVSDVLERGAKKVFSFDRFSREVFTRLFSDDVVPVEGVRPEDTWAADAHRELGDLPDFQRLRRRCRADRIVAGTATIAFAETILEKLPSPQVRLEDPEQLREQIRGLLQFAKNVAATGGDRAEVEALIADVRSKGQEAVRRAVEFAGGIDSSSLRAVLRGACDSADKAVYQIEEQVSAFCGWGTGAGVEQAVGVDVKAELARRVRKSDKLQALAREAGRLRRIAAEKQRSRVDHARDEVVDIELGDDLGRLLPSELLKLADPVLRLEVARRLLEKSAMQYRLGGKEPQGRGPIVLCIDQSSSMEGAKEIWSKSLALALLHVATMQKRACRVIHFNGALVRVDDWLPGKVDPLDLLRSMENFYGGGTAFEPPLRTALEAIERDVKLKRADVVLVTDGEAEISEDFLAEWIAAKKKLAFTCYAVHVDAPGGVAPAQLLAIANQVIGLADIAKDQAATDAVLGV